MGRGTRTVQMALEAAATEWMRADAERIFCQWCCAGRCSQLCRAQFPLVPGAVPRLCQAQFPACAGRSAGAVRGTAPVRRVHLHALRCAGTVPEQRRRSARNSAGAVRGTAPALRRHCSRRCAVSVFNVFLRVRCKILPLYSHSA